MNNKINFNNIIEDGVTVGCRVFLHTTTDKIFVGILENCPEEGSFLLKEARRLGNKIMFPYMKIQDRYVAKIEADIYPCIDNKAGESKEQVEKDTDEKKNKKINISRDEKTKISSQTQFEKTNKLEEKYIQKDEDLNNSSSNNSQISKGRKDEQKANEEDSDKMNYKIKKTDNEYLKGFKCEIEEEQSDKENESDSVKNINIYKTKQPEKRKVKIKSGKTIIGWMKKNIMPDFWEKIGSKIEELYNYDYKKIPEKFLSKLNSKIENFIYRRNKGKSNDKGEDDNSGNV